MEGSNFLKFDATNSEKRLGKTRSENYYYFRETEERKRETERERKKNDRLKDNFQLTALL